MIIAQITDLHLGFDGSGTPQNNLDRLKTVLADINALRKAPDIMLVTGDLTENGAAEHYAALKRAMENVGCPVHYALGNHDDRAAFQSIFSDTKFEDGFLQYTVDDAPLRIIVLDTLEPGRHGGALCQTRANWLEAKLLEAPQTPTLIALHHPPIATGIDWMTASPDEAWVRRLHSVLIKFTNVQHIISGHIHRTIYDQFAGASLTVSPAIAPQVKLELAPISPDKADGRPLIVDSGPGYCLHIWDGERVSTHTEHSPMANVLVKYSGDHSHIVRKTLDMKP